VVETQDELRGTVMYLGRYVLGDIIPVPVWSRTTTDGTPEEPAEAPYARVYSSSGVVADFQVPMIDFADQTGFFQKLLNAGYDYSTGFYDIIVTTKIATGTITNATQASPIVVTSASHGRSSGDAVTVSGVQGNTAANGRWLITYVNSSRFSLNTSTGNAAYTSGGVWNIVRLDRYSFEIVAGGDADGRGIALHFFDASPRPFVLMQTDTGRVLKLRNPRVS